MSETLEQKAIELAQLRARVKELEEYFGPPVVFTAPEETEPTREQLVDEIAQLDSLLLCRWEGKERQQARFAEKRTVYRLALEALDRRAELATLTAQVAAQAQEIERLRREWEDAVERERRLAPSLADTQVMARDAQAKLRAVEALHTDVLHRLASWAAANKRERQQGKSPTHLNAYTVALWLGVKEDELLAILTPEAQ